MVHLVACCVFLCLFGVLVLFITFPTILFGIVMSTVVVGTIVGTCYFIAYNIVDFDDDDSDTLEHINSDV